MNVKQQLDALRAAAASPAISAAAHQICLHRAARGWDATDLALVLAALLVERAHLAQQVAAQRAQLALLQRPPGARPAERFQQRMLAMHAHRPGDLLEEIRAKYRPGAAVAANPGPR